jgi:hypothetical protein
MVVTMWSFISAFLLSSAFAVPLDAKNGCGVHWVYDSTEDGNTLVVAQIKGPGATPIAVFDEYVS